MPSTQTARERSLAACAALAALQYGVISRAQALERGLSRHQVDRLMACGEWHALFPCVYRLPGTATSWRGSLMGACLWIGPSAAASHRSAAALWRLSGFGPKIVEITCAGRQPRPQRRIQLHRVQALASADLTACGPIPTTTPARTLLDLGAVVSFELLEVALDDALHRGIVTLPRLRWQLQQEGKKGRSGTAALRLALDDRSGGYVAAESALEVRVLRLIAGAGLPAPLRQYRLRKAGRVLARVDLAYPHAKVAIEADGYRYHSARADWQRDRRVQNLLTAGGWLVLRVTWEDVEHRPIEVAAEIRAALSQRFFVS